MSKKVVTNRIATAQLGKGNYYSFTVQELGPRVNISPEKAERLRQYVRSRYKLKLKGFTPDSE